MVEVAAAEGTDSIAGQHLDSLFVVFHTEDHVGGIFLAGGESIGIFQIYTGVTQDGEDAEQRPRFVRDGHSQYRCDGADIPCVLDDAGGVEGIIHNDAEDAEFRCFRDGQGPHINAVAGEDIGEFRQTSRFVFNKDRNLLNSHDNTSFSQ